MLKGNMNFGEQPKIAFSLDNVITQGKKHSIVERFFTNKYDLLKSDLNRDAIRVVSKLAKQGNYQIVFYTFKSKEQWKDLDYFLYMDMGILYHRLDWLDDIKDLELKCETQYIYCVDNLITRSNIVTLGQFKDLM